MGAALRSAEEMRGYLVGQLDKVLHRTDAFGGETAFWFLFNHLAALEEREAEWAAQRKRFPAGAPDGVAGAMAKVLPGCGLDVTASVYGEFARALGWLKVRRRFSDSEYDDLRDRAVAWCDEDRSWTEFNQEFGRPSVQFGPTQFRYGKTLAYVGADSMVAFHFRGGDPEPVLLAVREGVDRFTFPPAGRRPD